MRIVDTALSMGQVQYDILRLHCDSSAPQRSDSVLIHGPLRIYEIKGKLRETYRNCRLTNRLNRVASSYHESNKEFEYRTVLSERIY